ncbi:sigma factor [Streptomyces asiaticus]|uniref:sigma factor n=1 Tax=Streptomyces asiaticus TaxID=114695 RepID=UPI001BA5DB71|nr:sigma factor [Streptomyces asiaticus]
MNLTANVTVDMIAAAQDGDSDAMWQIVSAHDAVIAGIIRSVARDASRDDVADLTQEARASLVQHIRSYDTSADTALSTYAYRAMRRAVEEEWIRMRSGLSVDATTVLRVKRCLGEHAGNAEAAALLAHARYDISRERFFAVLEAIQGMESLDAPVPGMSGEEGVTRAETIPDPASDFTDPTERRELAHWLLDQIASRQSYALRAFYGIRMERATDDEVAAHLQTTRRAIPQLRDVGKKSARRLATAHGLAA